MQSLRINHRLNRIFVTRERHILFILVLIGLLLRVISVVLAYTKAGVIPSLYQIWGEKIADNGFVQPVMEMKQMIIAPFLPSLIALFQSLIGNSVIPFLAYNIAVSVLMIPVIYFLGKEVFGAKTGLLAALWCLLNPEFFRYNASILKEPTIFLLIPLTLLLLIYWAGSRGKSWHFLLSAISFTILVHTDERFIFFLGIFPLIMLFRKGSGVGRNLKQIVLWTGLIVLISCPWLIRNYLVYDQFVILSPRTTALTSFIWGENLTSLKYSDTQNSSIKDHDKYKDLTEDFKNTYGIIPHKFTTSQVYLSAFINYWQPTYFQPTYITYGYRPQKWSLAHNLSSLFFYGIFLPFYILGFILLIRKKNTSGIVLGTIPIIHSLLHVYLVSPLERYRYPIVFIIVIIGIWYMLVSSTIIKKVSKRKA